MSRPARSSKSPKPPPPAGRASARARPISGGAAPAEASRDHQWAASRALRSFGLTYPEAHTKSPWPGHLDLAVRDKTFAYLSVEGEPFSISCKLPHSSDAALMLPFVEPTGYGLGKSGWVTAKLPAAEQVPVVLFESWIDESYRAQAPKKLLATLDPREPNAEPGKSKRRSGPRS